MSQAVLGNLRLQLTDMASWNRHRRKMDAVYSSRRFLTTLIALVI